MLIGVKVVFLKLELLLFKFTWKKKKNHKIEKKREPHKIG
jgi:hypothetical protein